jgi:hypothetical protein
MTQAEWLTALVCAVVRALRAAYLKTSKDDMRQVKFPAAMHGLPAPLPSWGLPCFHDAGSEKSRL